MSYTNPYGFPQGPATKLTNLLREIMIAEIVAINGYQNHILNSSFTEINEVWHHIMVDEKNHYGIAIDLLRKYDPVEYKYFVNPHEAILPNKVENSTNGMSNAASTDSNIANITNIANTANTANTANAANTANTAKNSTSPAKSSTNGTGKSSSKSNLRPQPVNQADKLSREKFIVLNYLREDIKGELEAVILYEDELSHIQQKDARQALQKIIDDEKEHTEHLTQVLLKYDPDPYKPL